MLFLWDHPFRTYRTSLLKRLAAVPKPKGGLEIHVRCSNCGQRSGDPVCKRCKAVTVRCDVCDIACRGIVSFCPLYVPAPSLCVCVGVCVGVCVSVRACACVCVHALTVGASDVVMAGTWHIW